MEHVHADAAEPDGAKVLARGRGADDLQVELLQRRDGSVAVAFGLDGGSGPFSHWEAGDVEHGVRTFLSLVRPRPAN